MYGHLQKASVVASFFLAIIFMLGALGACQKKCQAPPVEPFKTVTEQQWRLVETSDPNPQFRTLSRTNFLIMTFKRNFTGDIKRVENNDLYETPVATFKYNVDSDLHRIRMEMMIVQASLPTDKGGGGGTEQQQSQGGQVSTQSSVIDYYYDLTREFALTGTQSGFYYRFVPFSGVVDPDSKCEF
jgi:hypothetical protein